MREDRANVGFRYRQRFLSAWVVRARLPDDLQFAEGVVLVELDGYVQLDDVVVELGLDRHYRAWIAFIEEVLPDVVLFGAECALSCERLPREIRTCAHADSAPH